MNLESYSRQVLARGENNYYKLKWGKILVRNFDGRGNLVNFKSEKHRRKKDYNKWILCDLYLFRDANNNGNFFPIFVCTSCRFMQTLTYLPLDQAKNDLERHKCFHSKVAHRIEAFEGGYLNMWQQINLNQVGNDQSFRVNIHSDIEYETLMEDKHILIAVNNTKKRQISILHTYAKVKVPECQTCTLKPCQCLR